MLRPRVTVRGTGGSTALCASVCEGTETVEVTVTGEDRDGPQGVPGGGGGATSLGGTGTGGTGSGTGSGGGGTDDTEFGAYPPEPETKPPDDEADAPGAALAVLVRSGVGRGQDGRAGRPARGGGPDDHEVALQGRSGRQPEAARGHVRTSPRTRRGSASRWPSRWPSCALGALRERTTRQTARRMIAAGGIEEVIFQIADALRVPVLIARSLAALLVTLFDLGAFFFELTRRNRRDAPRAAAPGLVSGAQRAGAGRCRRRPRRRCCRARRARRWPTR